MPGLEFVTLASDEHAEDADLEVVLLEKPTLDEGIFKELASVRESFAVDIVVILYGYSLQFLALRLSSNTTACLRMPVNYRELQRTVNSLLPRTGTHRQTLEPSPVRYSKDVLAKVAAMSPTIACECPRHVAEIIFALTDSETYSANCKDRLALLDCFQWIVGDNGISCATATLTNPPWTALRSKMPDYPHH